MKNTSKHPPLVLVADPNKDNLYLTATVVEDLGCRSISVSSGTAALQACKRHCPNLALLETRFPDVYGYEILAAIRRYHPRSQISAIAVTSAAMPGDRAHCLSMGFDNYLSKPYSIVNLEQLVYQYVCSIAQYTDFCRNMSSRFRHLAQESWAESPCNRQKSNK